MSKIIIYDSDHHGAHANRCFEKSYANEGPGHAFTVDLGEAARKRGLKIMTSDIFLKEERSNNSIAFCLTEMVSKNTDALLKAGAIPFLCFSFESPLIAKDFYINIKRLAGRFLYNLQFKGVHERLRDTPTSFSVMYFPVDSRKILPNTPWATRKYLVLINRNKRAFYSDFSSIKGVVRSILSRIKLFVQKRLDPWIRSKEIYKDRIEAIHFFSKYEGFHLYGGGWNDSIPGFPHEYHVSAKRAFKGGLAFDEKLIVMSQFKFAVCFENCSFPGYLTEKLFDCFLAGCIPIYYGAPDIHDFVPSGAFIDYRKFETFEELDYYLQTLPEASAMAMLQTARQFVEGPEFDKYYSPNIIEDILIKIEGYKLPTV
jgi:hypothetical protein